LTSWRAGVGGDAVFAVAELLELFRVLFLLVGVTIGVEIQL
jgi:hypothetical protein